MAAGGFVRAPGAATVSRRWVLDATAAWVATSGMGHGAAGEASSRRRESDRRFFAGGAADGARSEVRGVGAGRRLDTIAAFAGGAAEIGRAHVRGVVQGDA